eukprot:comp23314_c0_seq1/m.38321 comp23314_c0_seq1/g.38321  ORF comp23314_c0_seq1/g.38321 comp23314_c0_seq1/m.38321 type:complete len:327 (-) comp23314_c0_seq1:501-1481(-)
MFVQLKAEAARPLTDTSPVSGGFSVTTCQHKRFHVLKPLARNEVQVVNLAFDTQLNRRLVVKTYFKTPVTAARIIRATEAHKVASSTNHEHIVRLLDVIDSPHSVTLVEEYLEGGDLVCELEKVPVGARRGVKPRRALWLARHIVEGLRHLHSVNVAHRDVKLENCAIDSAGKVRIIDFGQSMVCNGHPVRGRSGTPAYNPPEILQAANCCAGETDWKAVDMWSFGVSLYVLLFARLPWSLPEEREPVFKHAVMEKSGWSTGILAGNLNGKSAGMDEGMDVAAFVEKLFDGVFALDPSERWTAERAAEFFDAHRKVWVEKEGVDAE